MRICGGLLRLFVAAGLLAVCVPLASGQTRGQLMALDPTGQFMVDSSGRPVWIQGDAPQTIGVQVSDADVDRYLKDRQARGYNAVWIILHDENDQNNKPNNYYKEPPFQPRVFVDFGSAYWRRMDSVIQKCAAHGMTVFANVTFIGLTLKDAYSLADVLKSSHETMKAYGAALGRRYGKYSNIIWLLGGDADPANAGLFPKLEDIAEGLRSTDPIHLITLEACRSWDSGCKVNHSSVETTRAAFGHTPSWLTLNWVYEDYKQSAAGCARAISEGMPAILGEDYYELEHGMTDLQLRNEGYWEALGGCSVGRLTGNMAIWTMGSWRNTSGKTWESQLSSPQSVQFAITGRLMRSRQFWKLQTDTSHMYLVSGYGSGTKLSILARTSDGQTMIAYIPNGNTSIGINLKGISDAHGKVRGWWVNPATGAVTALGAFDNRDVRTFTPPDANDWVLTLDSDSAALCAPASCLASASDQH